MLKIARTPRHVGEADGTVLAEVSEYLGIATNNVAEYRALILTLRRALDEGCRNVDVRMDSELVVRQLEGKYRVKDAKMQPLHAAALKLLAQFERADVRHVRRDTARIKTILGERARKAP